MQKLFLILCLCFSGLVSASSDGIPSFNPANYNGTLSATTVTASGAITSAGKTVQVTNGTSAAFSITPPASGTAYTNSTGYPLMVVVSGGTVTGITTARGASGAIATGLIVGSIILAPNSSVTITYTVAPIVTGFPM